MALKMNRFMKSSKLNEFRLWGLILTLGGMALMIAGTAGLLLWEGKVGQIIVIIFMVLGMLTMLGSVAIYFWAGILSTGAMTIVCPDCGKQTKLLGQTDRCMFCKTILTTHPDYAPQETEQD